MITRNDIIDALTKSTGYDSAHTPQPSVIVIDAWVEHFEDFPRVTRDDLLRAVKDYHRQRHDDVLRPVDISVLARKYSRDRYEASDLDSTERADFEALCDGKAEADVPQLGPGATQVKTKIDAYAQLFGLTGRQAEARMEARRRSGHDDLAYRRALVDEARRSGPPTPMPPENPPTEPGDPSD